ncbi:class I SAM-dependent methyltransferase [Desulfonatronum lacustre]|uniref:class I SAM-dependent methyltransferase n=1 Tax=Desulfonatronum lacustre TaxID=66849 RepID=UPI00146F982D|nr:methyltransferase domain-containing protein [Desulfonatronum lacustre]
MPLDHSLTYTDGRLRNLPHRLRLRRIARLAKKHAPSHVATYGDFGCSNGYLTSLIAAMIKAEDTHGFDHTIEHLAAARTTYPSINFQKFDLNCQAAKLRFDFVTCLETLEHVGNLSHALQTLLNSLKSSGRLLITVPVEIGFPGLAKIILKSPLHRELQGFGTSPRGYLLALLRGERLSQFRPERDKYSTHLGFDYRDIDDYLTKRKDIKMVEAHTKATTRFYVLQRIR